MKHWHVVILLAAAFLGLLTMQNPLLADEDDDDQPLKEACDVILNKPWLERAEKGDKEAQRGVGNWYERDQNYLEAAKWFRKSAEQGFASGECRLGLLYMSGKGAPQNYSEAAKWLHKSAEQGNLVAQEKLSILYENGQGVPKDYVQAYKWSLLAVPHYTIAVERQSHLEKIMTPEQIAEGARLSREWLEQHSQP